MPAPNDPPRTDDGRFAEKNKSTRGTTIAVVIGFVVAVGSGGTSAVTLSSGSSSGNIRMNQNKARESAKRNRIDDALRETRLRKISKKIRESELKCGPHSYGEVQSYFLRNPCRSLKRLAMMTEDPDGNTIAMSVAWVRMPSKDKAAELQRLADSHGTGNVRELGSTALGLISGVTFTGDHYSSRRDGNLVVIAQIEPVKGRPTPSSLDELAMVLKELPSP